MTKAKQVVGVLAKKHGFFEEYDGNSVVGLRCLDENKKLVDISIDKIENVCMSTIWHIEKEFLTEQGNTLLTDRELKSGKLVQDGSDDAEFVESVIKLLQNDSNGLSPSGGNKESCFHVTGSLRDHDRSIKYFEGYVLATNVTPASRVAMAYYMQTKNLDLHGVHIDIVKPVKMQSVFTPLCNYHEISLGVK